MPLDASAASTATQVLDPIARQHVPAGARAVGSALAGLFKPGQSLEQDVQVQPGKCYTAVATGVPTIQNIDVQLLATSPLPGVVAPVLAQDQTLGATAVLGAQPNCFHWALGVSAPLRLKVTVTAGEGIAAAQLYEK